MADPTNPASLPLSGEASSETTQGASDAQAAAPAPEAPLPAAPAVPPQGGQKPVAPPAPQANGNGHVEDGTAFAVLIKPRGKLFASQVVFGPPADIAAAIAAGDARAVTDAEIEIANPFHYPLPPADDAPAATASEA